MEHFWRSINGFFTFDDFYSWVAENVQGNHFLEMGSYTGQSAAYLLVEIANRQRYDVRLDLVDLEMTKHGCIKNLEPVAEYIGQVHEMASVEAVGRYADNELDFVFLDGAHDYQNIRQDIAVWAPKVKRGGWLSGHDYKPWGDFGVIQAVTERFPRVEVWRGMLGGGDKQMQDNGYWPCWAVQI